MAAPRVLVVEDDETLGEFFRMVLEMMPVSPVLCRSAEDALADLRQAPADVIVTDLLLPGLDGRGLLKALRAEGRLRGSARLGVMSGSIDESVRREMTQNGVWRVLSTPVTVKAFKSCIEEALAAGPVMDASVAAPANDSSTLTDAERAIIESHFAGQTALFLAYRAGSLQQFPKDIEQGDKALATMDVQGLRRVAHNLKGVLMTLGYPALAGSAKALEDAAATWLDRASGGLAPGESAPGLPASLVGAWQHLRDELPKPGGPGPL